MKRVSRWFINGLLATLPISITLYVAWWIASKAEGVFGGYLREILGVRSGEAYGYYFYGLGLAVMIVLLVLVGLFLEFYLGRLVMSWGEAVLSRIPVVKQLYSSVKETIDFFNPEKRLRNDNYMVMVNLTPEIRLFGYVTRDSLDSVPGNLGGEDDVVVILPFCFQMGGNTLVVPRRLVRRVDLGFEEGMKLALSGFVLTPDRRLAHKNAGK